MIKDNRPKFVYDVVIRNKGNDKIVYAKIVESANAGEAKNSVIMSYGISLSRSEYNITATRIK